MYNLCCFYILFAKFHGVALNIDYVSNTFLSETN